MNVNIIIVNCNFCEIKGTVLVLLNIIFTIPKILFNRNLPHDDYPGPVANIQYAKKLKKFLKDREIIE